MEGFGWYVLALHWDWFPCFVSFVSWFICNVRLGLAFSLGFCCCGDCFAFCTLSRVIVESFCGFLWG